MLPTFLVIGASRCGTTSLQQHLAQHPAIAMAPIKSPNFFVAGDELPSREGPALRAMARRWVRDPRTYERLFEGAAGAHAIGEVSPVYLQSLTAPEAIRKTFAEVKIVAVLRDPVDRAYAHYVGRLRDGLEKRRCFGTVVDAELSGPLPDDIAFGSYLGCSRYHHFLEPYFRLFPREHIRIYLFEELQSSMETLLADLFEFLGVEPRPVADTRKRHNETGEIEGRLERFLWTRSVRLRTALRPHLPGFLRDAGMSVFGRRLSKPPLDPDLRQRLADVFRSDVGRLEGLIQRDLSGWRHGAAALS